MSGYILGKVSETIEALGIPKITEVYRNAEEDVSEVGRQIADTKNKTFDVIFFGGTLVFIVVGGTILLYGPILFQAAKELSERIRTHGIHARFDI